MKNSNFYRSSTNISIWIFVFKKCLFLINFPNNKLLFEIELKFIISRCSIPKFRKLRIISVFCPNSIHRLVQSMNFSCISTSSTTPPAARSSSCSSSALSRMCVGVSLIRESVKESNCYVPFWRQKLSL